MVAAGDTRLARCGCGVGGGSALLQHRTSVPWQSPGVLELAQCVGQSSSATPMVIEGRTGVTMAAVGEQRDHAIAQRAVVGEMNKGLQEKLQRAAIEKQQLQHRVETGQGPPPPGNRVATFDGGRSQQHSGGGGTVALSAGGGRLAPRRHGQQAAFGAVYEYRDSVGKPRFVAGTAATPEAAFAHDFESHAGVRELFDSRDPSQHGRAKVVWVGVGGGAVGHAEMASARDAVVRERSERHRITELRGAKPYSRHSHLC
jgi:hypothetical protein